MRKLLLQEYTGPLAMAEEKKTRGSRRLELGRAPGDSLEGAQNLRFLPCCSGLQTKGLRFLQGIYDTDSQMHAMYLLKEN